MPGLQTVQEVPGMPWVGTAFVTEPAGQGVHTSSDVAPVALETRPSKQKVHVSAPTASPYEPAWHVAHVSPCALVPAGHALHAEELSAPPEG